MKHSLPNLDKNKLSLTDNKDNLRMVMINN